MSVEGGLRIRVSILSRECSSFPFLTHFLRAEKCHLSEGKSWCSSRVSGEVSALFSGMELLRIPLSAFCGLLDDPRPQTWKGSLFDFMFI